MQGKFYAVTFDWDRATIVDRKLADPFPLPPGEWHWYVEPGQRFTITSQLGFWHAEALGLWFFPRRFMAARYLAQTA